VDGEIIIATAQGLDFDALQLRLHPAASRVAKLAAASPSSFVAFDALATEGRDIMGEPQRERRRLLEELLADVDPPLYLTPMTRDRDLAERWLAEFEGAGLDGVIAKPAGIRYEPGSSAGTRPRETRSARSCWGCTTTRGCCSTWG
jgi:ATP-dependent DNA ligase